MNISGFSSQRRPYSNSKWRHLFQFAKETSGSQNLCCGCSLLTVEPGCLVWSVRFRHELATQGRAPEHDPHRNLVG